ncbi:MAG: hypothetical protein J0H99_05075 [Rhodospirillales bacterium]|nr:hypothetical protein [Rhodospirillales bacterium]MBN8905995.1 hypothetical protein [Rhodospirillales bacterium]
MSNRPTPYGGGRLGQDAWNDILGAIGHMRGGRLVCLAFFERDPEA